MKKVMLREVISEEGDASPYEKGDFPGKRSTADRYECRLRVNVGC